MSSDELGQMPALLPMATKDPGADPKATAAPAARRPRRRAASVPMDTPISLPEVPEVRSEPAPVRIKKPAAPRAPRKAKIDTGAAGVAPAASVANSSALGEVVPSQPVHQGQLALEAAHQVSPSTEHTPDRSETLAHNSAVATQPTATVIPPQPAVIARPPAQIEAVAAAAADYPVMPEGPASSSVQPESQIAVDTAAQTVATTPPIDLTALTSTHADIVAASSASEMSSDANQISAPLTSFEHSFADLAPPRPVVRVATPHVLHRVQVVALGRKRDALQHLLVSEPPIHTLIFTRTKHGADKISRFLDRVGFKTAAIHGDKSHGARNRALAGFKAGEIHLLVITDIAARALDIEHLPIVINYDLPHIAEDYLLRVARTGSAAQEGLALSIITQEESPQFRGVRALLQSEIEVQPLPGFEAADAFDPERDPLPRPENDTSIADPAARPAHAARPPRAPNPAQPSRRERGGRHERGPRPAPANATPDGTAEVVVAEDGSVVAPQAQTQPARHERGPRPERTARPERNARPERKPRPERGPSADRGPTAGRGPSSDRGPRPERGARPDRHARGQQRGFVPRGDEQPYFAGDAELPGDAQNFGDDPSNAVDYSEVEGHIERGNSATPIGPAKVVDSYNRRRRNGRHDPFAPVEVNEEQASIYDERQPDDFRDQWSVLGPSAGRPAWTFADQGQPAATETRIRSDAQPRHDPAVFPKQGERRPASTRPTGPRGAPPRPGQSRGGQSRPGQPRQGRPKRADGR